MTNYVFLGRHGDRQDFQNANIYTPTQMKNIQDKWLKSKRHSENPYDPPITKFGYQSAMKVGNIILSQYKKSGMNKILLYSSPFSRSVMTAGAIQDYLKKNHHNIPIRIEYGLTESITLPNLLIYDKTDNRFEYKEITDTKLTYGEGKNNDINLDDMMISDKIFDRFPEFTFDKDYHSILPFIPSIVESYPQYADRLIAVTNKIIEENPDTFIIIIGHADLVRFGYDYYSGMHLKESEYNSVLTAEGFGSYLLFKKDGNDITILDFKKSNTLYNTDFPNKRYKGIYYIIVFLLLLLLILLIKCDLKK
jgi:broad specificity phosphatase PhoE